MAGFQWKIYLKGEIELTSNELDPISFKSLVENAKLNDFHSIEVMLMILVIYTLYCKDISVILTINKSLALQLDGTLKENSIEFTNKDCNILMHERQFNFMLASLFLYLIPLSG